jgi:hypothetical protein
MAYDGNASWIAAAWALGDGAEFFSIIGGFLPHLTSGGQFGSSGMITGCPGGHWGLLPEISGWITQRAACASLPEAVCAQCVIP